MWGGLNSGFELGDSNWGKIMMMMIRMMMMMLIMMMTMMMLMIMMMMMLKMQKKLSEFPSANECCIL
jgi:hypothetical protein